MDNVRIGNTTIPQGPSLPSSVGGKSDSSDDSQILEQILEALQQMLQLLQSGQQSGSGTPEAAGTPATPAVNAQASQLNPALQHLLSLLQSGDKKGKKSQNETEMLQNILKDLQEIVQLLQGNQTQPPTPTPAPAPAPAPAATPTQNSIPSAMSQVGANDRKELLLRKILKEVDQILTTLEAQTSNDPSGLPTSS